MKNTDTRIQYSRMKLQQALLTLLQTKPIDKVTVKELCETANLNRGTFYLHYDSPLSLLRDMETHFFEESMKMFDSFWQKGRKKSVMECLFQYIRENGDVFRILMGPNGDPRFSDFFSDQIRESILDQWQLEFPHYRREDMDFMLDFLVMGSMRLILNWLEDSRGITATEFTRRIERLGHHALLAIREF